MKRNINEDYLLHLGGSKNLGSITSLDLSSHDLSSLDVHLFNKLTSLKSLDVSQNQLTNIPEDLKLPALQVLDCTQNSLSSVTFVKNFTKLKELYFGENKKLTADDEHIVKLLCPSLCLINDYEDSGHLDSAISLYTKGLKPQLKAVWEARFTEVYGKGVPAEEIDSLHQEFLNVVRKSGIVGSNLTMIRFRDFMIDHLSKELILNINKGTHNSDTSTHSRQSFGTAKSPRYGTRVSSGVTPLKDYSSGTPMEVDEDTRQGQGHMPKKGQGHNSPRKGQMQTTPVRTPKRRRNDADDDGEKGTPLKVRKMERKSTPNTPKLTGLKQNHNNQDGYQLPRVDDYDPEIFLRCHSKGNNPADDETKIWTCAFEPRVDREGETTNIVATCGGKMVCLIDCQTGKVMKRYKDNSKSESFYTLTWTTLKADMKNLKEDINILAVAGHDGQIKLINPRQLVMFGVMEGHRCYISSLIFHPKDKNILFSASRDDRIIVWNIGIPDFKNNKVDYNQMSVLSLPNTDAISMSVSPDLNVLVAGCEKSCYAWNLKKLTPGTKNISPHYKFVHPQKEEEEKSSGLVDSLAILSNNCIVSKCVGHNCLYMWDLKQHCVKTTKAETVCVLVQPLAFLEYKEIDVDYLYLSAFKDLIYLGDDKGSVYMYDLKKVVKQGKKSDVNIRPSRIIEYPETSVENRFTSSMSDVGDNEVVINCVAVSSSREFLVYGTDNNLVAIWRNSTKL